MQLPKNLKILPGVKQDHNGKLFQHGAYPSGKIVMVPYTPDPAAEMHQPIMSKEPVQVRRVLKAKQAGITHRKTIIDYRFTGERTLGSVSPEAGKLEAYIEQMHPLCTSPDCGKTWRFVETHYADFYNIRHEDVKEVEA